MICPRCKVEMMAGIAIKPNTEEGALYICAPGPIKAKDVKSYYNSIILAKMMMNTPNIFN